MKIKFRQPENSTKIFSSKIIFLLFSGLLFFSLPGYSQNSPAAESGSGLPKPPETSQETNWEEALIQGNVNISRWFDTFAEGLDLFLVGKRVTTKRNDTQVEIETSTVITEKDDLSNTVNFGLNLRLPNVEEYWHLKFSSYNEQEEGRNLKNSYLRQTPRRQNYGATVGLLAKLGNVRTSFQPRIELQDPLKVAHSLTFESVATSNNFEFNPKVEFYGNSDVGVGTTQALNFHFQLSKSYSLTLFNQGDYQEKAHTYDVNNGISYGHVLNHRESLAYTLLFTSSNRSNYHLRAYNISVAYDRVLYRRVLNMQLIPNIDFSEDYGFERVVGLTTNFNLMF